VLNHFKITILILLILLLFYPLESYSHSGRTNSSGCHNRRGGGYHCHGSSNYRPSIYKSSLNNKITIPSYTNSKGIPEPQKIKRIIDGDTFVLEDKKIIRLIGVDTPEKKTNEYFHKEATEFLRKLIEGKKVILKEDKRKTDKFGRSLYYIHLQDGTFVNAEIVKNGYGSVFTKYPFKHQKVFINYQKKAKEEGKGKWSK